MDQLSNALKWHKEAVPNPTDRNKCISLGVHFEEIAEMLDSLSMKEIADDMHFLASCFKSCDLYAMDRAAKADKIALLDSVLDQNVTSCGISNAYGFNHIDALAEVNRSNYSKFENGKAVFNEQGKISKGKNYTPPDLAKFIQEGYEEFYI